MTDIPDDVMHDAVEACRKCLDEDKAVEWAAIYAILAERKRCADICEDYCSDHPDLAGHGHSIGLRDAVMGAPE